jgi:hypothetical protein
MTLHQKINAHDDHVWGADRSTPTDSSSASRPCTGCAQPTTDFIVSGATF